MTEVRCPKCGEKIQSLNAFSLQENSQTVFVADEESENLEWDEAEPVENSCVRIMFECPQCNAVLFENKGDACDERVLNFLKTGEYGKCKEKVEFT